MNLLKNNTPLMPYKIGKRTVWVKREDLCVDGPSFSKLRGVAQHIQSRKEKVIGVLDTFHSKAGWGTAMLCEALGKKSVVFYPVYKGTVPLVRGNQLQAKKHGARLHSLNAGRSFILYHQACAKLREEFGQEGYMLPNALKCVESVQATSDELDNIPKKFIHNPTTWIVSVSSGTIAAGVVAGLVQRGGVGEIYLHQGYSRPNGAVTKYIETYTDLGFFTDHVHEVDQGWEYKQAASGFAPFPCNPYYDLKAWLWLNKNIDDLVDPIIFWNIGA